MPLRQELRLHERVPGIDPGSVDHRRSHVGGAAHGEQIGVLYSPVAERIAKRQLIGDAGRRPIFLASRSGKCFGVRPAGNRMACARPAPGQPSARSWQPTPASPARQLAAFVAGASVPPRRPPGCSRPTALAAGADEATGARRRLADGLRSGRPEAGIAQPVDWPGSHRPPPGGPSKGNDSSSATQSRFREGRLGRRDSRKHPAPAGGGIAF